MKVERAKELQKEIKEQEKKISKEEKWLLREINFLEDFKEDIAALFKLKQEASLLQKSAEQGKLKRIQAKVETINELISKDKERFRKLRKKLSRGERRRIRYEKRVLGNIATLEQQLDKPTQKALDNLAEQIHIYSVRVLSELSWRVGKISKLSSQKTVDFSLIQKHISHGQNSPRELKRNIKNQ